MDFIGSISYNRLRQIGVGQGLNSEVYLVRDPQLGGEVAAKEIDKSSFRDPAEYFAEGNAMFAAAHDNVIAVQYVCQSATTVSLVMRYFRRGSLFERIQDRPLTLSETLRVAQGVLLGLAHIHLRRYIHFDLKPSNVLFSDIDKPMVADFGQSRSISATGVVDVPKLYFTAQPPETIRTGVATIAADIYHAGLLLYRALNGDPFYNVQIPGDDSVLQRMILAGKLPDRRLFMPHVPARMRTLVKKALRVDPSERFQTATQMADALGRVDGGLDWATEPLGAGALRWKASREGLCDLVVELTPEAGAWEVRTFTEKSGEPRRAKDKDTFWRRGLSRADAFQHLQTVFENLPG